MQQFFVEAYVANNQVPEAIFLLERILWTKRSICTQDDKRLLKDETRLANLRKAWGETMSLWCRATWTCQATL